MAKKLSIVDIIKQKEALKQRETEVKTQTLFIPSLESEIVVQKPSRALLLELKDMPDDGNDYLVYQCTVEPNLKGNREQLMKEFGCAEPHEIVKFLFTMSETAEIVEQILALAGINQNGAGVKVVEAIKN